MIREIYTKALLAKGAKTTVSTYKVQVDHPCDSILGCWIVDHHHEAKLNESHTYSVGSYEVHLWYSYASTKSAIFVQKMTYCDEITVKKYDEREISSQDEAISRCIQEPKCLKATILETGSIELTLEKVMEVNVVGETMLKIEMNEDIGAINTEFIK